MKREMLPGVVLSTCLNDARLHHGPQLYSK
jgi:hypothetical protein